MQRGEWPESGLSYRIGSAARLEVGDVPVQRRTASLAGYFGCCAKSDLALLDVDLTVGGGGNHASRRLSQMRHADREKP